MARWLRRLCAERIRRRHRHDRAAEPDHELLRDELSREGSALEGAVAGDRGDGGGVARRPGEGRDDVRVTAPRPR